MQPLVYSSCANNFDSSNTGTNCVSSCSKALHCIQPVPTCKSGDICSCYGTINCLTLDCGGYKSV